MGNLLINCNTVSYHFSFYYSFHDFNNREFYRNFIPPDYFMKGMMKCLTVTFCVKILFKNDFSKKNMEPVMTAVVGRASTSEGHTQKKIV